MQLDTHLYATMKIYNWIILMKNIFSRNAPGPQHHHYKTYVRSPQQRKIMGVNIYFILGLLLVIECSLCMGSGMEIRVACGVAKPNMFFFISLGCPECDLYLAARAQFISSDRGLHFDANITLSPAEQAGTQK